MNRLAFVMVATTFLFIAAHAFAADTISAPAAKAASKAEEAKDEAVGEHPGYRTTVVGEKDVRETDTVGTYGQPVWTAKRRFTTTRVYVMPAGEMEIEYWLTTEGAIRGDSQPSYESQIEFEIGLGHRMQLDSYLCFVQEGYAAPIALSELRLEFRYAFADWGKLFGNPTIYLEWFRQNAGPQGLETKILVGDQISPRWFWGANIVFERAFGGEDTDRYGATAGISYVIIDNRLLLGVEAEVEAVDVKGSRFDFEEKHVVAGPSLQIKPVKGVHIDFVPMAGVRAEKETDPFYKVYFIIGKEL